MGTEQRFRDCRIAYAAERPGQPFLVNENRTVTAAQAEAVIQKLSTFFRCCGMRKGTVVALRITRTIQGALLFLALQDVEACTILTDAHRPVREEAEACAQSITAEYLISEKEDLQDGACFFENWCMTQKRTERQTEKQVAGSGGIVIFTSGSTAKSKAVLLGQKQFLENIRGTEALGGYQEQDRALALLPMNHIFGLALLFGAVILQHTLFFPEHTDVQYLLHCVETYRLTRMNGIPSVYQAMAEACAGYDLSTLRYGLIGGAPSTPEQFCAIEKRLGMTLIPVYGMSECIGISCASWRDGLEQRSCGVGPFYKENTGKIIKADGTEAAIGEEGEICVKGPAQMTGYLNEEEAGSGVDAEGFLHAGDLGYLDAQCWLHISGRKKEIFIRNGYCISFRKIEEALLQIPEVREAAVVALDDPKVGEIPAAMVVLYDAESCETLHEKLKKSEKLTRQELPEWIVSCDFLPKTASGKTDKQKIRYLLEKGWKDAAKAGGWNG